SILIERDEAGDYKGLKSLRAMAAGGRRILPADLRRMKLSSSDELSADTPHNFDTVEEQLKVSQATTRRPTPAWAVRARKGPYPQTDPGHQEYMPEAPLFRDTTSSHEWKSDVDTWSVPDKFFPGHRGMPSQPDELVVTQALQYPETELVEEVKASPERAGARRSKNRRLQEQSDRSTEIVSEMEVETSPPAEER
ncbi:MAG: hypothetical protein ACREJF_03485, partial [Candidatus Methylomirabilales bacterium]